MTKYDVIDKFSDRRVVVVGDVMLDIYEIAEPAPDVYQFPVFSVIDTKHFLGGAGNVAANARSLGAEVYLFGETGSDMSGEKMDRLLKEGGIENKTSPCGVATTTKRLVVTGNGHTMRIDREDREPISHHMVEYILREIDEIGPEAMIIADYGKGVVTPELCRGIIERGKARGFPVFVDPKSDFGKFRGSTMIKPNRRELMEFCSVSPQDTLDRYCIDAFLVTADIDGMDLYTDTDHSHTPAFEKEPVNDVGAGDTVIATCALAVTSGASFEDAMEIASHAAAIAVRNEYVHAVTAEELEASLCECLVSS
ncbi:MAG: hypothetical protein ISS36_04525 [Candidatus Aenigmarchaeota archaeon]|nr:hypothetical protein [Candidatus Aenigmarchaeota archaeon]